MPLRPVIAAVLALSATASCSAPEADFTPSDAARSAPPPELLPNARFAAAFDTVGGEAGGLEEGAADLAARAAALQARAAALDAPVIDPAERARLEAAAAAREPAP